jgi:hypothetical protein
MIINKEAFKKGRKAASEGLAKSDNPYTKSNNKLNVPNSDWISWNEGYDYVKKNNLKESKFEKYLIESENKPKLTKYQKSHNYSRKTENKCDGEVIDGICKKCGREPLQIKANTPPTKQGL